MLYCMYIPLPAAFMERVRAFERRWQGASHSDPHITLIVPQEIPDRIAEEQLTDAIRAALSSVRPFPILAAGIGHFKNKSTVYVSVSRTNEFAACQKRVSQAFEEIAGPCTNIFSHIPVPHITLATHLSFPEGNRAWKEARQTLWNETFLCTTLQLLRASNEDKRWIVRTAFHLA